MSHFMRKFFNISGERKKATGSDLPHSRVVLHDRANRCSKTGFQSNESK